MHMNIYFCISTHFHFPTCRVSWSWYSVILSLSLTLPLHHLLFYGNFAFHCSINCYLHAHMECVGVDNVASLPSRVPAKCVVCCLLVLRPSLHTPLHSSHGSASAIVQTPAGCVFRIQHWAAAGQFCMVRLIEYIHRMHRIQLRPLSIGTASNSIRWQVGLVTRNNRWHSIMWRYLGNPWTIEILSIAIAVGLVSRNSFVMKN